MLTRCILLLLLSASLVIGDESHGTPAKLPPHRTAKVHSGAQDFGRQIEKTFRSVGGHLQKFFTGHDTISR